MATEKEIEEMWKRCPYKKGETVEGNNNMPVIVMEPVKWISWSTWEMKVFDLVAHEERVEVLDKFSNQVLDENYVD